MKKLYLKTFLAIYIKINFYTNFNQILSLALSTTHQLLEIYHTILTALDSKCFTSITFADVSKTLDRVWIGGLLLKLERYGIKGDLLMWLKSYLTNTSQKVAIKEALSELDDLTVGVPQGSVLGSLLFLVFINDIADDMLGLSSLFCRRYIYWTYSLRRIYFKNMINIDLNNIKKWGILG